MYNIKKNIDLSKFSKFEVGGIAEFLFIPQNLNELINFIKSKNYKPPLHIVGAGSNLLFDDGIIIGTTILTTQLNNIKINKDNIIAECGVLNSKLFNFTKNNNIGGFEFLGCIPGTVGGACKTNAGCYNSEIKDILINIKTIDLYGNIKTFTTEECNFEYRKIGLDNNLIFLEASFKINTKKDKNDIEATFKEMMNKKITSQPINEKTCGSTFKNPKEMPAWKVIQEIGLQNVDFNGVKFSEKHANFLVNVNSNNSQDIKNLIDIAIKKAKEQLNIDLQLEIQIIGNK